jgi:hypothetical protein
MGPTVRTFSFLLVAVAVTGCSQHPATVPAAHSDPDQPATPVDAPPRLVTGTQYGGGLRPGWTRYEQRRTLKVGETMTAGPEPYAKVKLVEIAGDRHSAVFEATHLVDHRRGRVVVGESFNVFTPVFGSRGAKLESISDAGATVVFHWSQSRVVAVPPGAVATGPGSPKAAEQ